ncbi:bifunctional ADP-dependent NAD(P)H-hydrate dehydratase/NAD(P)H-hydrate epimerase [Cohnella thermotolerans]|uniref:bifunctional ADP-dependent NAD(P)H-hydrate dehydratase/NAD(P)H-hydrate epimerase n=1 Tax=Cohnella thermotolerans TaxID=329858 RepID=UPI0004252E2D|nr:bifunctional ADP-dependent NAD(P)H-hydrate dehydratase/NAD(P)H-hydrate epimerase [Cohnella thermotolerans]
MYLVTSEEMRRVDRYTIDTIGIPSLVLMENAGRAIAEEAFRLLGPGRAKWAVLVGKGNNGGDGLVCARHLAEFGHEAEVVYAVPPEQLTGEAAVQRDIAARLGLPARTYAPGGIDWREYGGIVDALLGTGTAGAPREPYASLIREANASGLPIVAADIPSGLNADTGEAAEPCVRAAATVALAMMKRGLLLYPGAEMAGRVVVRAIGIPETAAATLGVKAFVLNERTLREKLGLDWPLRRAADTHKGTYGHALVAAGSRAMSGAGLLAAKAALRAGCGLVSWALPASLAAPLLGRLPEAMLLGVPDEGRGDWSAAAPEELAALAEGKRALVIGPGLGRFEGDASWLRTVWEATDGVPLVVDADALNMLASAGRDGGEAFAAWPRRTAPVVLTPHPGEMARLAGLSVPEVQRDRIGLAQRFAERHGVTLALKGARTVVAAPDGTVYVNTTGNPGMATGGSGDVLAGIVGSLLAQGLDAVQAAAAGVYMHGAAGDRAAAARTSAASLLAGDIIESL